MSIKAIVFDLDGTLVNSIEDIADSMNFALSNSNYPTHTYKEYEKFIGSGLLSLVKNASPSNCDKQEIDRLFNEMFVHYTDNCANKTGPYQNVVATLNQLHEKGILLGVLSNKLDKLTKFVVKNKLPNVFFDVRGMLDEATKKPNPSQLLTMFAAQGCALENVLFVGDSIVDLDTAKNAGVKSVGVTWGYKSKEALQAENPSYLIENIAEILNII